MSRLALIDILRAHFFVGMDLGPGVSDILAALHVDEYDTAWDDDAVVIWGVARIDSADSTSPVFSPSTTGAAAPGNGIEWHDLAIRFRMTAARRPAAALPITDISDAEVRKVLSALGPATGTAQSDYPNTQFRMELLFELVDIPLPGLKGAKLDGWVMVPDPENPHVKLTVPRLLLILTQDSAADTAFNVDLGSFGAETIDDHDPAINSLIAMKPPLALVPGDQFGFGLQKVVLDLSAEKTPPDILDRFGVGDDWKGLYCPEVRFFVSTQRSAGVAFNVGAREMLIGFEPTAGLWGDFNFDVEVLGDQLRVGLRLYGVNGQRLDPEWVESDETLHADRYRVTVPSTSGPDTENYVLFVDVLSGAAPFTITFVGGEEHPSDLHTFPNDAFFDDPSHSPENISVLQRTRLFSHDQRVAVRVTSRNPQQRRIIVLDVYPDLQASPRRREDTLEGARILTTHAANAGSVSVENARSEEVLLRLSPPEGATLTVDGSPLAVTDGGARVRVAGGGERALGITWNRTGAEELRRYSVYFEYDHPWRRDAGGHWNIGTPPFAPEGSLTDFAAEWNGLPSGGRLLRVDAYASRDSDDAYSAHNTTLSENRRAYLLEVLAAAGVHPTASELAGGGWGNESHPGTGSPLTVGQVPGDHSASVERATGTNYDPRRYWVAVASILRPTPVTDTFEGRLVRDPTRHDEIQRVEPPAPQGQHPNWLRHLGGTVRFDRDAVPVAGELRLTVDFQTAHEDGLERFRNDVDVIGPGLEPAEEARLPQGNPNPDDGVVEFRLAITHDPSTGTFTETLVARAGEGDRDGLWSWGAIPSADAAGEPGAPQTNGWRDVLGLYFTLAPLLATTASNAANGGDIVPLVIGLAAPVAITVTGVAHVLRFTHYGVELDVRHDDDEVHASLLFDVESALWLNLKIGDFEIVTCRPDKPIKVRYKAIGFGLDVQPSQPTRFLPVFDSSRGYTIDLADSGSLRVLPALGDTIGDIIQVMGARIARTNPLNIEVELGLGVDLGVFSVDRFGFRLPVDPLGAPSITAIGVGVNIPDVLKGTGYLEIKSDGFAGQLDLTLPSVGMRVAGALAIRTVTEAERSATGVMVTLAVELPAGIPLGGTGLALFGFLGLFAMHHQRLENGSARNPALDWLVNVAHGDPTDLRAWGPKLDQWAFGVGLVAGTIEGGTVLNLKGMLALEIPGPRVLLFVKANVLSKKPPTKGTATGTLFAVVDVSPQRVLIGIQFEYHIESVLDLMIPIDAGFFYDPPAFPPEHFYVDVGSIARPVTAKILQLFDATAYFMVHGDGIPDFPLGQLQGFAIATGFRVSFTWGNTDIGLYLRVAAGFDAGIGFAPLFFAGRVFLEGELRLFIIGLRVRGDLKFLSDGQDTRLEGRICGRVDFFFFSVEGCVGFALGNVPGAPFPPAPIRDLKLQSRSPALVDGTGVDRGIDTVLCRGTDDGSVPKVEVRDGDVVTLQDVYVPIDTIPLIQFEVAPDVPSSATIDGQLSSGLPPGFGNGWQKRGPNWLRYHIRSIELRLLAIGGVPVAPGTPSTTEGPRPYTWRHPAQQSGSDGLPVELALLDWKPTNADKVMVQGKALDGVVGDRWGDVCTSVAEAARVLWTFRAPPLGPSPGGWQLVGKPWPDAPGTRRSLPVETKLRVEETWRTHSLLDGLLPALPAKVVGTWTKDKVLAKVLEAPSEMFAEAFPVGVSDPLRKALQELESKRKEDLRDVVRITGGPFLELTLLVFARIKMVDAGLLKVRAFASGGLELPAPVDFKAVSSSGAELPGAWRDGAGPWKEDVALARAYFATSLSQRGWSEYLVTVKLPSAALIVDIGISPLAKAVQEFGLTPPSWHLAVASGLSEKESRRAGEDGAEAEDDKDGLEDALGDQKHALLIPNARYEVRVRYDAEIGQKPTDPEPGQDPDEIVVLRTVNDASDARTFYTDAEPPRSLDPWMLAQFPSPGDGYHFTDDPVVIVFGTDDVLELFKAYQRQLRAVARAASFRGSAGTPNAPFTHLMLTPLFQRVGGVVLSPWEATVRRLIGNKTCGSFDPNANRHGRVTLPFKLDPLTDYVVDVEALTNAGAPAPPSTRPDDLGRRPLFRHSFTTSRYRNRGELAESVRLALPVPRTVQNPALIRALAEQLGDEAFDRALHEAGLEVTSRPDDARVTVLWSQDAVAQPVAVLIETPEPLWRTRTEPKPEYDDAGVYIQRWTMAAAQWLSVDELVRAGPILVKDGGDFVRRATGTRTVTAPTIPELRKRYIGPRPLDPPPIVTPPASLVARLVRDASGTRTLAVLKPGARGAVVSLGLARNLHPLLDADATDTPTVLLEISLGRPPWEEE
ncbi:hypothetical protein LZC95_05995 [Pendulispora brunnea]|uniref:Uncharacterized protein n=1 Tax=Pendulispora brunnea TaxID=2905690 RepID=A0ABZ2KCH7_9BACT